MNHKIPSLVIIAFILAFIIPIAGLILGIIALRKVNKIDEKPGRSLAIASIVIGAILTVPALLIFVGAIAYFGALSPTLFVPDNCLMQAGFECEIQSIETNEINLELKNIMGKNIIIKEARVFNKDIMCVHSQETLIENNGFKNLNLMDCDLSSFYNKKINFDIEVDYHFEDVDSTFESISKGNFVAQFN